MMGKDRSFGGHGRHDLGDMAAGDKHALSQLDARTLCMQPGAEESRLSFDFVAGQGKGQEQLFRGKELVTTCFNHHRPISLPSPSPENYL